ncbi:unnamed protein product [Gongylonema pulchrum]|uniref:S8_pro-domain domain-containing protein n=1 Tax=Gongylonema pulchrum TaxID=637853 RepID=A0A183EIG4_9BILA|nr:unnamed protein product [Gongylonema pulchrum]
MEILSRWKMRKSSIRTQKISSSSMTQITVLLLIIVSLVRVQCYNPLLRERVWRQRIAGASDDEGKLIALLPQLLRLREELQQPSVAFDNNQDDDEEEYDNEWVVQIVGGPQEAKNIAQAVGYKYIAPMRGFEDIYIFSKDGAYRQKRKADSESTLALRRHKYVVWAEQQRVRKRYKRDDAIGSNFVANDNNHYNDMFNDPFWPDQWNLVCFCA